MNHQSFNKNKTSLKKLQLIALLFSTLTLSACVTALVAGATIATIDIIHDRRTVGEYLDDSSIELAAKNYLLSSKKLRHSTHVKVQSWNGILLLTGEIDDSETKQQITQRLIKIRGVRQLIDETALTSKTGVGTRANDSWITSKIKSKLVLKTGIDANRVKVITTRGVVYLMGIVTRAEADKVVHLAKNVKRVQKVVKVFEYTTE